MWPKFTSFTKSFSLLLSLETLGKLESVQGVAYYVLVKKLEFLQSEFISHMPSDWRSWSFKELLEALRKWTDTNTTSSKRPALSDRVFFSRRIGMSTTHVSIVIAPSMFRRIAAIFLRLRNETLFNKQKALF